MNLPPNNQSFVNASENPFFDSIRGFLATSGITMPEEENNEFSLDDVVPYTDDFHADIHVVGHQYDRDRIYKALDTIKKTEIGRFLVDALGKAGYRLEMVDGLDSLGVCSPDDGLITLDKSIDENTLVATLAHEMRHAMQYNAGLKIYPEVDSTKTQIQINRAMEADAESFAAVLCMQLREQGNDGPWNAFKQDGAKVAYYVDRKKSRLGLESSTGENTYALLMSGFKAWYKDYNIREEYDNQHIDLLKEIWSNGIADKFSFDRTCEASLIIKKLCNYKNQSYFDGSPDLLNKKEYSGVSNSTMNRIENFFKTRNQVYGSDRDPSLKEIPIYEVVNEQDNENSNSKKKRGNSKSVYWGPMQEKSNELHSKIQRLKSARRSYRLKQDNNDVIITPTPLRSKMMLLKGKKNSL